MTTGPLTREYTRADAERFGEDFDAMTDPANVCPGCSRTWSSARAAEACCVESD